MLDSGLIMDINDAFETNMINEGGPIYCNQHLWKYYLREQEKREKN